jgi:hypothetical protein
LYGPTITRGSVLSAFSSKWVLLTAFRTVTYVEIKMSMGFLYVNSQLRDIKPKAIRSKPTIRTGNGRARLKGILKMFVI